MALGVSQCRYKITTYRQGAKILLESGLFVLGF